MTQNLLTVLQLCTIWKCLTSYCSWPASVSFTYMYLRCQVCLCQYCNMSKSVIKLSRLFSFTEVVPLVLRPWRNINLQLKQAWFKCPTINRPLYWRIWALSGLWTGFTAASGLYCHDLRPIFASIALTPCEQEIIILLCTGTVDKDLPVIYKCKNICNKICFVINIENWQLVWSRWLHIGQDPFLNMYWHPLHLSQWFYL